MTFRLKLLGGSSLWKDGRVLTCGAAQRRSLALLALLASHGSGISRERLASLLWPERDEENARNSLKQALYVLRRDLEPGAVTGAQELRLDPAVVLADVVEFEQAVAAGHLDAAVDLYGGPFLDGFHIGRTSEEFERWADSERQRLADRFREILEEIAGAATRRGDAQTGLVWWRRLAKLDPLSGRFARGVIGSLAELGDRAGALDHVRQHRELLQKEMGISLDAETERLVSRIERATVVDSPPQGDRADGPDPAGERSIPHFSTTFRGRLAAAAAVALMVVVLGWMALQEGGVGATASEDDVIAQWGAAAALPTVAASMDKLLLGIKATAVRDSTALNYFASAAAIDPGSGTPLVWASFFLTSTGRRDSSARALRALEASARLLGPWDRAMIRLLQARNRGDLPGAHVAAHSLLEAVPGSEWALIAAHDIVNAGRPREALELIRKVDPDKGWIRNWQHQWVIRDYVLHSSEEYDEELRSAREGLKRDPDSRLLLQMESKALAGLGRMDEAMERCLQSLALRADPRTVDWQPCTQAIVEIRAHGDPARARALADQYVTYRERVIPDPSVEELIGRVELYEEIDWPEVSRRLDLVPASGQNDPYYVRLRRLESAWLGDRAALTRFRLQAREAGPAYEDQLGSASLTLAAEASLLGDRDAAVSWMAEALNQGMPLRFAIHWMGAFDNVRAYPPFRRLVTSVDTPEHIARYRGN